MQSPAPFLTNQDSGTASPVRSYRTFLPSRASLTRPEQISANLTVHSESSAVKRVAS